MLLDGFDIGYSRLLRRHVVLGEVAEGRVLASREQLVVSGLEGLVGGAGEELLEVVFHDHGGSVADLRHVDTCLLHLCHLVLLVFFLIIILLELILFK